MRPITAVLFDLDGTLIDSEALHLDAWFILLKRLGLEPPPHDWADDCVGLPDDFSLRKFVTRYPALTTLGPNPLELKQEAYRELITNKGPALAYPGLREPLTRLRDMGVKIAIGTNSNDKNTMASLAAIGFLDLFPVVVTCDQVKEGKPAPDIYLLAAERLGVKPGQAAVVEDSLAGMAAGKAAGCRVLGLTTSMSADKIVDADDIFPGTVEAIDWVIRQASAPENARRPDAHTDSHAAAGEKRRRESARQTPLTLPGAL